MKQLNVAATPEKEGVPEDPERFFSSEHLKHDLRGNTIRGGAVSVGSELTKQLFWIISTVVLARLLSPADNGLVAMAVVITNFIGLFSDLGLSAATIQREHINQAQVSALFWINVAVGIMLALLTIALAPVLGWVYGEPRLVWITIVISSSFIFNSLTIQHRTLLRRQMRFSAVAVIEIFATAFETTVAIIAAYMGFRYWAIVLLLLAGAPLRMIGAWIASRWRPSRPAPAKGVGGMLVFGGNLTGFTLANYVARNIDNLLIGRMYGAVQLGFYSKAYNLLLAPLQRITAPIGPVALTVLSRLVGSPERYRETYMNMASKIALLTMPLVAFMIGASDWLVVIVLGEKWLPTSQMFAWLGLSGLVEPFAGTITWLLTTQGRTRQQFHWGVISSACIVGAILVGLPWGAVGVAASYSMVSLVIRVPVLYWYVGREGPVRTRDLYRTIAPYGLIVGVILLALYSFRYVAGDINPLVGITVAAVITAIATLLSLSAIPSGRATLRELKTMPLILLKRTKAA